MTTISSLYNIYLGFCGSWGQSSRCRRGDATLHQILLHHSPLIPVSLPPPLSLVVISPSWIRERISFNTGRHARLQTHVWIHILHTIAYRLSPLRVYFQHFLFWHVLPPPWPHWVQPWAHPLLTWPEKDPHTHTEGKPQKSPADTIKLSRSSYCCFTWWEMELVSIFSGSIDTEGKRTPEWEIISDNIEK